MTAPQTETRSAPPAPPYPPRPPTQEPLGPRPPSAQEAIRSHMGALAILFLLTSITAGVIVADINVTWSLLRFFLLLYTIAGWYALGLSVKASLRR